MKKLVSILLTLIMVVSIIPLSSITASAASNSNGWEIVYFGVLHDTNDENIKYSITISKRFVKKWIGYTTELSFEATKEQTTTQYSYVTRKMRTCTDYTTASYVTSYYNLFGKSNEKDVMKSDYKLKNVNKLLKNVIGFEECINRDYSGWSKQVRERYSNDINDLKIGLVDDSLKDAIGVDSSFIDTLKKENGTVTFVADKYITFLFGSINKLTNIAKFAINPTEIIDAYRDEFMSLYEAIFSIRNSYACGYYSN